MNGCYWFRQGICISPALDKPTDSVTSPKRCLTSEYKTCNLYRDPPGGIQTEATGLEKYTEKKQPSGLRITELMVKEVYAHETVPESPCPFFIVTQYDGKYFTYCNKKKSWLTKSQSFLCLTNDQNCPWRSEK